VSGHDGATISGTVPIRHIVTHAQTFAVALEFLPASRADNLTDIFELNV
jgi:hypothetical protein